MVRVIVGSGGGRRLLAALLLALACNCSKPAAVPPAADAARAPSDGEAVFPTTISKRPEKRSGKANGLVAAKGTSTSLASLAPVPTKIAEDDLRAEEPEANPYSETVTLRLSVTPPVKALVMWGGKQVAKLAPGNMEAEIVRPRGSGPVDLEIKAEGFMPHHTRLYSDRNDKISARLYRPEEAPGLFGYKRSPGTADKKKQ
jgi:hypothetical protein